MKTIYISGPMTGMSEFNFPLFNSVAAKLRAQGYTVINPAELVPDTDAHWTHCMMKDLAAMVKIGERRGILYLLPGWKRSTGARIEREFALELGWTVRDHEDEEQTA